MENKTNKKIFNLKTIVITVLSLLLILIFLSRTIYNFNLPAITAALPQNGRLNKIELTNGIVKYEDVNELYSEVSGTVNRLLVHEGDVVSKGQPIMEMSFEGAADDIEKQIKALNEDTQKKLDDLKISREKLQVDIEKINVNIKNTQRKIEELKKETYRQESVSDYELTLCESDIARAEEELEKSKALFEAGAISRQELTNAEHTLENLSNKYDNLKRVMNESTLKSADAISDKEMNRQKQLKDYEYQLEAYEQDLKSKQLDLNANAVQEEAYKSDMETKIADYRETLADYERNTVIYAPEESFVISIEVNKGQHINAHQQLASFGLKEGFIVDCEVSLNNNFVIAGDICALYNSSRSLEGLVTKVTPTERSKMITISIQSGRMGEQFAERTTSPDQVTAGETFDIKFEKESGESYTLVPNGTVCKGSDGYFLNQVKRRDGILGKEFYIEKLRVYIGDSDSQNTIIIKGLTFFEPVVLISDKPFSEGETIKLTNESDFFDN